MHMQRSESQKVLLQLSLFVLIKNLVNSVSLVKKMADCSVVVECINDICNVLAHINLGVPVSCKKLGSSVNEVGGKDLINNSLLVSLVKLIIAVSEQTEGCKHEYTLCTLFLKLLCYVNNRVAR